MTKEIQRTYDLYQEEKMDKDGFSRFYLPLEERRKQIESEIPRLQGELDILEVNTLSAEEIASQASNLYDRWQTLEPEEKREIVEIITDRIVIGKGEITISPCYVPSCKEMAKRWRKGSVSNPFCHLVIRAIRGDSHPLAGNRKLLSQSLRTYRVRHALTQKTLAAQLGIRRETLMNWEHSWTAPNRKFWGMIARLIRDITSPPLKRRCSPRWFTQTSNSVLQISCAGAGQCRGFDSLLSALA